ncbi:MAG: diaminopimelate epimerase [Bacteroidetes bacterium]|nr:diaminopimelate epimerase [Bacteroidota bacterium]
MLLEFYKYQGTGNDFILLNNLSGTINLTYEQVKFLCDRRFGIGADGLMLIETQPDFDFKMVYYNSDGNLSSMCGNGGRCIVAFAKHLNLINQKCTFLAVDGPHDATLENDNVVALKMNDVKNIEVGADFYFLNTGSPHYVKFVEGIENYDVFNNGKIIRNSDRFIEEGTNVNFIEKLDNELFVRTYERGVENETYSCGTGVTAAAIIAALTGVSNTKNNCLIKTLGGNLEVTFDKVLEQNFYNIWLKGPANLVFKGTITINE